jgi:RNA polymerase sigma factor (sigma-70 family)
MRDDAMDVSLLLAHERWAARLARALLHDDDLAEDIVQEARVSFWRARPRHPDRARSWMGTVVRNFARSERRKQAVRQRAMDTLARQNENDVPGAEQLAQRLEGHRLLATLVSELREPYREAILLRYYEGLTGADIARRLGVPAGTIRWRLKTALEELRDQLDRRHEGKRDQWLGVMAAVQTEAANTGPQSLEVQSSPVVAIASVIGVLVVVLVAISLVVRKIARESPAAGTAQLQESARPDSRGLRIAGTPRPPSLRPGEIVGAGRATSALPAWAVSSFYPPAVVAGRVIADGLPVAKADLRLTSGMLTHARALDRHATSRSDGGFEFGAQPATNWFLTVTVPGRVPEILYVDLRSVQPRVPPQMQPPDQLTIELRECRVFAEGQVRDMVGPVAGARVRLTRWWNNGGVQVVADSTGRYRLCVPADSKELTLVAEAEGYGTVETLAYLQSSREIDFLLEPAARVSGHAVLLGDGDSLPNVKITLDPLPPHNPNNPPIVGTQPVRLETTTDDRGQFSFNTVAPGSFRVQAVADGATSIDLNQRLNLSAGGQLHDVEVRMTETTLVEGTVRRAGDPVPDVSLVFEVLGTPTVPEGHHVLYPSARSAAAGRYQVQITRGAVVGRILGAWPRKAAPRGFVVTGTKMTAVDIEIP